MPRFTNATAFLLITTFAVVSAQDYASDARSLGMVGATSTIAEGIYAIGYNPARLAYSSGKLSMKLGGFTWGLSNNMLSIANYNLVNGADFIDSASADYVDKEEFLAGVPEEGWRIITNMHMPMPGLNWARGTTAFSSNVMIYGDLGFPKAFLDLVMVGNPINKNLDMNLDNEAMGTIEWAFSFAIPMESVAFGVSLKYLQGLFYIGVDQDSSYGYFRTDSSGFQAEGRYLIRQAVGGAGFGLDIGVVSKEYNGYRFGASLINAMGKIRWFGPSITKDLLGDTMQGMMPWRENEYFVYSYKARDVTLQELLGDEPLDSLFTNDNYTVFESADSGLVRSEGRDISEFVPRPFTINYPSILRIGASRHIENTGTVSVEIITGFQDRLWVSRQWEFALGVELEPSPVFPLRFGLRYGGKERSQMGMGFGIHTGPVHFDFGFALHNGWFLHTTKGFSLALGLSLMR